MDDLLNLHSIETLTAKLNALREEHRPIVQQLQADVRMEQRTRQMLLEHLYEEEEEIEAKIVSLRLSGQDPATPSNESLPTNGQLQLTLGSLRRSPPPWDERVSNTTLGSMRND